MKVNIGPYKTWIGSYQVADWLQLIGVSKDRCHKIGKWLSKTFIGDFLRWAHSKKERREEIHIDEYDVWSMDYTLSLLILPMLKLLQEKKHGAPYVDDEDVPEHLRSISAPPKKNEWDIDDNHFERWDWVLGEMIWTFTNHIDTEDIEGTFYDHTESRKVELNFDTTEEFNKTFNERLDKLKHDKVGHDAWNARKKNGFRLFGKYFQSLWD